ncbi:hypothetical protein M885DRAFT_280386 [Pelagophyceae sp. CCMP2097]|nr:hypothetical protein M885DRAFT_280386 [Pelagophyceae sp. CCMP2097]
MTTSPTGTRQPRPWRPRRASSTSSTATTRRRRRRASASASGSASGRRAQPRRASSSRTASATMGGTPGPSQKWQSGHRVVSRGEMRAGGACRRRRARDTSDDGAVSTLDHGLARVARRAARGQVRPRLPPLRLGRARRREAAPRPLFAQVDAVCEAAAAGPGQLLRLRRLRAQVL